MSVALVLEKKNELTIREIELNDKELRSDDVRIAIRRVGVCGSDVHYYSHGRIGPYVVNGPMVLGHEASGVVIELGSAVKNLKVGDRVCMEPGVPNMSSRASKLGIYNVDPDVSFWATPPVHGCLTANVVHPASFTYKLPENVSFEEGAMVEPFATGMQATTKAQVKPGDIGLVTGAGTIGIMTAQAALAGGCAKVFISDVVENKLSLAEQFEGVVTINAAKEDVAARIAKETDGWGVDVVFECSGAEAV
jgi:D-xylulose reductase